MYLNIHDHCDSLDTKNPSFLDSLSFILVSSPLYPCSFFLLFSSSLLVQEACKYLTNIVLPNGSGRSQYIDWKSSVYIQTDAEQWEKTEALHTNAQQCSLQKAVACDQEDLCLVYKLISKWTKSKSFQLKLVKINFCMPHISVGFIFVQQPEWKRQQRESTEITGSC